MDRREFLARTVQVTLALGAPGLVPERRPPDHSEREHPTRSRGETGSALVTLFLGGDVMTGRGIDQVLPHPGDPRLFEPYVRTATRYVELAEETNGPISKPVDFSYIWGDALEELERMAPDARIVNLETSVTASDDQWRGKGIHYRMHPANVPCLSAAGIDCCALANNHVLDWGTAGLDETVATLERARIKTAGAGSDLAAATAPAVLEVGAGARVLVFGFGTASSGIPREWAAGEGRPGVSLLPDLSQSTVRRIAERVQAVKRAGDLAVASIHWGSNWGYDVPSAMREFAHALIEEAGVDAIHGHSSHHAKGIEVYRDRPILYGCGDLVNDYEGIRGYEEFRSDVAAMYFASFDPLDGRLVRLRMSPMRIQRFRLNRAATQDAEWLGRTLTRQGEPFGTRVEAVPESSLELRWG